MSSFNEAYRGTPPWDIGRPQPEFVKLSERGGVVGDVLDVGCGTGEHAIYFAAQGHRALGVDSAPLAIEKAREKAKQRKSSATFELADALDLSKLGRQFDAAVDSGVFHVFPDRERREYVRSLASVLRPGGKYFMLCFSDKEPSDWGGPRRISKSEILDSFKDGWTVNYVQRARFEHFLNASGGEAWLSSISRVL